MIDDDEEEGFDFIFDGTVRAPREEARSRPRIETLKAVLAEWRAGQAGPEPVKTILGVLEKNIREVITECGELMNQEPDRRDFFAENLAAYQYAFEALQRVQAGCARGDWDWIEQGLSSLDAAVAEVNRLVAIEQGQ